MEIEEDRTFYTVTMARVYANQGRYEAAARIYRYLLDRTPDQADLKQALDAVLSMLPEASEPWHALDGLVAHWVRLTFKQNELRRLEKIRLPSSIKKT